MNKKIFETIPTRSNLKVFCKVAELYGNEIRHQSYKSIGERLGMSDENVRYHFKALERTGYLEIEYESERKLIFYLAVDKLNSSL